MISYLQSCPFFHTQLVIGHCASVIQFTTESKVCSCVATLSLVIIRVTICRIISGMNWLTKMEEKKETKSDNVGSKIQIEHKRSLGNITEPGNLDIGAILKIQDKQPKELSEGELITINEENYKKLKMSQRTGCKQKKIALEGHMDISRH